MDWISGYTAEFYICLVDPATWRDVRTIDVETGNVSKTSDGIMESASMKITEDLGEALVRVYINARNGDDGGRAAIFTGLLQTPSVQWEGNRRSYNAECYSVLKAAEDVLLSRGWYADINASAADVAADLLGVIAPVTIEGVSPKLQQYIVAEDGETNLSMAQRIIDSIGWRIRIAGDGTVTLCEAPLEPIITLDSEANDIIEVQVTDTQDLFSCPNVFRATANKESVVVRDEALITARGREIWAEDSKVVTNSGESLAEYAQRRLIELQSPARTITYNRRFLPGVVPGDMIGLRLPGQNIEGNYIVTRQKITLGYNATVAEEVEQV